MGKAEDGGSFTCDLRIENTEKLAILMTMLDFPPHDITIHVSTSTALAYNPSPSLVQ